MTYKNIQQFNKLRNEIILRVNFAMDSVGGNSKGIKNIPERVRDGVNRLLIRVAKRDKGGKRELSLHVRDIKPLIRQFKKFSGVLNYEKTMEKYEILKG